MDGANLDLASEIHLTSFELGLPAQATSIDIGAKLMSKQSYTTQLSILSRITSILSRFTE